MLKLYSRRLGCQDLLFAAEKTRIHALDFGIAALPLCLGSARWLYVELYCPRARRGDVHSATHTPRLAFFSRATLFKSPWSQGSTTFVIVEWE